MSQIRLLLCFKYALDFPKDPSRITHCNMVRWNILENKKKKTYILV